MGKLEDRFELAVCVFVMKKAAVTLPGTYVRDKTALRQAACCQMLHCTKKEEKPADVMVTCITLVMDHDRVLNLAFAGSDG